MVRGDDGVIGVAQLTKIPVFVALQATGSSV